ncbi:DUF808 domain-containing protein [uncultured Sulfuricurvum sp.]|uniref:DUF808 domain-containing protein n=2 Tax=Sulfuricurvum TaxID=286130 RepID=UPI00260BBCDE|nr:DUF808 domain-containing protein [uncultured Sulfuricurvum sp.]
MAGSSLLLLIDDITAVLDDVAAMSKTAAQKTTGVLGDDLALNAQQVAGVRAERELPVVYAVAKGSLRNKLILVPSALALSALAPWSITPILMLGGTYLCYEGFEKIAHPFLHSAHTTSDQHDPNIDAFHNPNVDMEQFEKEKIQGAIRTDFILSAEIIVIALGTVADKGLLTQSIVVSGVAFVMTVGVYGAVAAIVKMDDVGLYLLQTAKEGKRGTLKRFVGSALLSFAPRLMKTLTLVGTAAMFLVGGGILVHGLSFIHHWIETLTPLAESVPLLGNILGWSLPFVVNAIAGVVVGGIAMAAIGMLLMVVKIFRR